jgi:hypothetical protein
LDQASGFAVRQSGFAILCLLVDGIISHFRVRQYTKESRLSSLNGKIPEGFDPDGQDSKDEGCAWRD